VTAWFDERALQAGGLTPEQTRKVRAIEATLGRSDRILKDHLISIDTFGKSAGKAKTGRVTAEWPRRIAGLQTETLAARARLDRLDTGLRAQRVLRSALTELASAFGAWHRGLSSTDVDVIDHARASMQRHFTNAGRLGRSGLADLKAGR
jgi:hypothetical protein